MSDTLFMAALSMITYLPFLLCLSKVSITPSMNSKKCSLRVPTLKVETISLVVPSLLFSLLVGDSPSLHNFKLAYSHINDPRLTNCSDNCYSYFSIVWKLNFSRLVSLKSSKTESYVHVETCFIDEDAVLLITHFLICLPLQHFFFSLLQSCISISGLDQFL
ncbi:hypothetical protein BD560DRAFT_478821 [Blakeslea trispora]|nr:hypothetical protein BD560DRAFT_478821 [Blakeslea trispora]